MARKLTSDAYSSPETRARLLRSMTSTPKQSDAAAAQKQSAAPSGDEEEQVYFPGENIPVEYENPDERPAPNGFMNENMARQIQNWEDNYTPDEENQEEQPMDENPDENEQE